MEETVIVGVTEDVWEAEGVMVLEGVADEVEVALPVCDKVAVAL